MSSCWDNFWAGQKVCEEWKENFRMSQESFEKLCTELRLHIQKNKTTFRDPTSSVNFFGAITDNSCSFSKNIRICFVFTLAKLFPRDYLTKQHSYFANGK